MTSSRHRDPGLTVRPPAAVKAAAQRELAQRGRETKAFVVACLNALISDPDGFLEHLAEHWPADTPRGRPRKATGSEPAEELTAGPRKNSQAGDAFSGLSGGGRDALGSAAPLPLDGGDAPSPFDRAVPPGWGPDDDASRALAIFDDPVQE